MSFDTALKQVTAEQPGLFSRYAPLAALGTGTALATGMFTPKPPEDLNIAPKETGFDLLRQSPEIYGTAPGGAQSNYVTLPGGGQTFMPQYRPVQLNPVQYPNFQQQPRMFAANGGIASVAPQGAPRFAQGGIAAVAPRRFNVGGYAGGGPSKFPRRTGQIAGPGTEKSDSIPAMLSDGEFVMTAKAVRGAGGGSRREGAKRMYQMMHKFEGKA
jgi:hypothetical protein